MVSIALLDVVRVVSGDLPGGVQLGDEGTVVDVLAPDVFEVEFIDDTGRACAIEPLHADQLVVVYAAPTDANSAAPA